MFDQAQFLADLKTFVGFKTVVSTNKEEFRRARAWIKAFFDPDHTAFVEREYGGLTSLIVKPRDSRRPRILGDGHIEVVPGADHLFELVEEGGGLYGRGVADMKTQCLMMMYVLRRLIAEGRHNDFWLLFTEDEEVGSDHGVREMVNYLCENDMSPHAVFAPDGGPDFAYVEKEKGIMSFTATTTGMAAHASRPFLGDNAVDKMIAFYAALQKRYPNPTSEQDWIVSLSMTRIAAGEALNAIPDRCEAGFDVRLTERENVDDLAAQIEQTGRAFDAEVVFGEKDTATYYPKEAPIAQQFISILRRVSGKEPEILHSNGASNGRLYVAKNPGIHVLMSNPTVVGPHTDAECVVAASLEPYYQLVLETALL
ncbi:MAG: M20/M25/M40 family metallo-hydrolase [Bacteroidetes bacterium]|nr:M20/M25/M40 family metallo-hydrolase [Bacteroidota bacterium]